MSLDPSPVGSASPIGRTGGPAARGDGADIDCRGSTCWADFADCMARLTAGRIGRRFRVMRMIVVGVRGRRSALVGWRALVAGALAIAVAWMPMAPVAFVIIGAAMTLGLVLLLLVPRLLRLPAGRDRAFGNPR
ncbi:MAG: hypothetical protein JNK67_25205 [Alphaproteobacteria bacterium]|nr:hypothetical protein [Alphaproteobacteria bacterium]